jgi:hypothetical protein
MATCSPGCKAIRDGAPVDALGAPCVAGASTCSPLNGRFAISQAHGRDAARTSCNVTLVHARQTGRTPCTVAGSGKALDADALRTAAAGRRCRRLGGGRLGARRHAAPPPRSRPGRSSTGSSSAATIRDAEDGRARTLPVARLILAGPAICADAEAQAVGLLDEPRAVVRHASQRAHARRAGWARGGIVVRPRTRSVREGSTGRRSSPRAWARSRRWPREATASLA